MAYFDVLPSGDGIKFEGTWSNYPFFKSGLCETQNSQLSEKKKLGDHSVGFSMTLRELLFPVAGVVAVSSIEYGLFLLKPDYDAMAEVVADFNGMRDPYLGELIADLCIAASIFAFSQAVPAFCAARQVKVNMFFLFNAGAQWRMRSVLSADEGAQCPPSEERQTCKLELDPDTGIILD